MLPSIADRLVTNDLQQLFSLAGSKGTSLFRVLLGTEVLIIFCCLTFLCFPNIILVLQKDTWGVSMQVKPTGAAVIQNRTQLPQQNPTQQQLHLLLFPTLPDSSQGNPAGGSANPTGSRLKCVKLRPAPEMNDGRNEPQNLSGKLPAQKSSQGPCSGGNRTARNTYLLCLYLAHRDVQQCVLPCSGFC